MATVGRLGSVGQTPSSVTLETLRENDISTATGVARLYFNTIRAKNNEDGLRGNKRVLSSSDVLILAKLSACLNEKVTEEQARYNARYTGLFSRITSIFTSHNKRNRNICEARATQRLILGALEVHSQERNRISKMSKKYADRVSVLTSRSEAATRSVDQALDQASEQLRACKSAKASLQQLINENKANSTTCTEYVENLRRVNATLAQNVEAFLRTSTLSEDSSAVKAIKEIESHIAALETTRKELLTLQNEAQITSKKEALRSTLSDITEETERLAAIAQSDALEQSLSAVESKTSEMLQKIENTDAIRGRVAEAENAVAGGNNRVQLQTVTRHLQQVKATQQEIVTSKENYEETGVAKDVEKIQEKLYGLRDGLGYASLDDRKQAAAREKLSREKEEMVAEIFGLQEKIAEIKSKIQAPQGFFAQLYTSSSESKAKLQVEQEGWEVRIEELNNRSLSIDKTQEDLAGLQKQQKAHEDALSAYREIIQNSVREIRQAVQAQ